MEPSSSDRSTGAGSGELKLPFKMLAVGAVGEGSSVEAVALTLLRGLGAGDPSGQDASPELDRDHTPLPEHPVELMSVDEAMARIGDEVERAEAKRGFDRWVDQAVQGLPLLPGETATGEAFYVLAREWWGMKVGTVVYDRKSDRSEVRFFFPTANLLTTRDSDAESANEVGESAGDSVTARPATRPVVKPNPRRVGESLDVSHATRFGPKPPPGPFYQPDPVGGVPNSPSPGVNAAPTPAPKPRPNPPKPTQRDHQTEFVVQCIFGVAGCLAWALPGGPILAGGVTLLDLLTRPAPSGPTLAELLEKAIHEIDAALHELQIAGDASKLAAFAGWMSNLTSAMAKLRPADVDWKSWLPAQIQQLRDSVGPNGQAYVALHDLKGYVDRNWVDTVVASVWNLGVGNIVYCYEDFTTTSNEWREFLKRQKALVLYMHGVGVYLHGLRYILQLEAMQASLADRDGDETERDRLVKVWLNDYAVFKTALEPGNVVDTARRIVSAIEDGYDLDQLNQQAGPFVRREAPNCNTKAPGCWYFNNLEGGRIEFPIKTEFHTTSGMYGVGGSAGYLGMATVPVVHAVEDTADAVRARDKAVNEARLVRGRLKELLRAERPGRSTLQIVQLWEQSIREWNEHLPPRAPEAAPRVDANGWTGAPPKTAGWMEGNYVSYAVAFVNSRGEGPAGPYCEPVAIQAKSGCTLYLPQDPLGMATHVRIKRKIVNANGSEKITSAPSVSIGAGTWRDAAN